MNNHAHIRRPAAAASSVGVQISGLQKSYRTRRGGVVHAVRGVDVSIGAGETVALLGPNGAGKSTTIDILSALTKPDAGTVSVFGRSPAAAVRAGSVGSDAADGRLVRDLAVRELLELFASLYQRPLAVDEVLELTGLTEIADQRTQKLSGGQTQRVRFALALVSDPDLLVLDEPTVAMDVEGRQAFWTRCGPSPPAARPFSSPPITWRRRTPTPIVLSSWTRAVDRRRADDGDQGARSARPHPGDTSRGELDELAGCRGQQRRTPRRRDHARLRRLRHRDPGLLERSRRTGHRDQGAGLEEAFLELTPPRTAQHERRHWRSAR